MADFEGVRQVFTVRYLCVLDPGCEDDGSRHSLNCQTLNAERYDSLRDRERRFRSTQMQDDLERLPKEQ